MKTRMSVLLCLGLLTVCMPRVSRVRAQEGPYLGQPSPGLEAQKFAPGIISVPQNWEQYPMWSPDGLEFYYCLSNAQWGGGPGWRYTQGKGGLWTDPVHIDGGTPTPEGVSPLLTQFGISMGPAFSSDGRRVYLMATQSVWMSERQGDGWSQPRDLDLPINPTDEMWWISVTNDGTIYLTLGREATNTYNLFRARPDENGQYPTLESMAGKMPYQNMFFHRPAPDESYMILSQWNAAGTYGGYDLYITFRDAQDNWTAPKNLGPAVNTGIDEMAAFVTADGKYLFYNTRASSVQNADIYWIETRDVLPDPNGPISNPNTDQRFNSIQCAIDWAEFRDEIVLTPGTYRESISLRDKELVIRSSEPNGLATEVTLIQGDPATPVIELGGYGRLENLSIVGGSIGVVCTGPSASMSHCRILQNRDDGIHVSSDTHLELSNCIIAANGGAGIRVFARDGRRTIYGRCTIANCTIAQNTLEAIAGEGGESTIANSIVYFNGSGSDMTQIDGTPLSVTYCSIEGGAAGEGSVDVDPFFASLGFWDANVTPEDPNDDFWMAGDYHLKSQIGRYVPASGDWAWDDVTSPCIDAGDSDTAWSLEPQPNGTCINIGAYGGTTQASLSPEQ
jgi:Right handed beta helix region/WD40-like Beta Propeller Repeat